jgi:hypothetical protein
MALSRTEVTTSRTFGEKSYLFFFCAAKLKKKKKKREKKREKKKKETKLLFNFRS